jgi:hypothetical protein
MIIMPRIVISISGNEKTGLITMNNHYGVFLADGGLTWLEI